MIKKLSILFIPALLFVLYSIFRTPLFFDWGFHSIYYLFPQYMSIIIGSLAILGASYVFCFPQKIHSMEKTVNKSNLNFNWFLSLIVLLTALFYLFPQHYPLLGDGSHVIELIKSGNMAYEAGFIQFYKPIVSFYHEHMPLTKEFHIFHHTAPLWGLPYLLFGFFLSSFLGKTLLQKIIYFCSPVCLGTIQYFFGYTEVYSMAVAFHPLFILFNLLYFQTKKTKFFILAFFSLVSLMFIHFGNMFLIFPFFVTYLYFTRNHDNKSKKIFQYLFYFLIVAMATVSFYVLVLRLNFHRNIIQFLFIKYSFLQNIIDLSIQNLNYMLLSGPILLYSIYLIFISLSSSNRSRLKNDYIYLFLLIGALGAIAQFFFPIFCLGPLDWDAASSNSYILLIFIIFSRHTLKKTRKSPVIYSLIILTFSNTFFFISVNASSEKSINRYLDIMEHNRVTCQRSRAGSYYSIKKHNVYLSEQITFDYLDLDSLASEAAKKSMKIYEGGNTLEDAVLVYNMGISLAENNETKEAVEYFKKALEIKSNYIKPRISLVKGYRKLGLYDSADYHSKILYKDFNSYPIEGVYVDLYGMFLLQYSILNVHMDNYLKAEKLILELDKYIPKMSSNSHLKTKIQSLKTKSYVLAMLNKNRKALEAANEYLKYSPQEEHMLKLKQMLLNRLNE